MNLNKINFCKMIFAATVIYYVTIGMSQTTSFASTPKLKQTSKIDNFAHFYSWFNSSWNDDDLPYQKIRTTIEKKGLDSRDALANVNKYQTLLEQNPKNDLYIFAYYDSLYWAWYQFNNLTNLQENPLLGIASVVMRNNLPKTYSYERLAFLCATWGWPDPNLKLTGIRLLKHDPNDYWVEFNLILVVATNSNEADRAYAIKMADKFLSKYPSMPIGYFALAYAYQLKYANDLLVYKNNSFSEGNNAIINYQKYLSLSPTNPNAVFGNEANLNIEWLKMHMKSQ